jgi:RNA polymerase sigma-70 factor (ECF subfamily)
MPEGTVDHTTSESDFESLYLAHSAEVLRYALRRGASHADAEEVVEETFTICWRRLPDVPNPALPWLLAVARRVLANQRRTKGRRSALYERLAVIGRRPPPSGLEVDPDHLELKEALSSLKEQEREVLALVVWQGLTHEAAAEVLGCTRNAVTKRYLRACSRMKAQLTSRRT